MIGPGLVPSGKDAIILVELARFLDDTHQRCLEAVTLSCDLRHPRVVYGERVVQLFLRGGDLVGFRAQLGVLRQRKEPAGLSECAKWAEDSLGDQ